VSGLAGEPTTHLHSFDARCQSLPTVLHEVEGEEPFEIFGPLQHLGVPQGASRIVVSRAPMLLHACSREFIILGMPFIIPGAVNQVDDVEDLPVGDCAEQPSFRAVSQVLGKLLQEAGRRAS
jgi:hypothetical protein